MSESSAEFTALTARNRATLERMFDPGGSYGRACLETIADLVQYRLIGSTVWSGNFRSKHEWAANVFFALPHELDGGISLRCRQMIVEGDFACVRAGGRATVRNGRRYDNEYCFVYRFAGGYIVEVTEYLDTELITHAFGARDQHQMQPARQPGVLDRFSAITPASYDSRPLVDHAPGVEANKATMRSLFSGPPPEYGQRYLDLMADDIVYQIEGKTRFSGVYRGKDEVVARLFEPLLAALDGSIMVVADRLFAAGDWVCVQARGLSRTRRGRRYDNDYCLLYRLAGGRIREVFEYLDTELVTWAFGDGNPGS